MTHITLMRGIPGSGKSTVAACIAYREYPETKILSTDDYWYRLGGSTYAFDIKFITDAHRWNQERAALHIPAHDHVIIDNTNITSHAVAPYFDLAVKYNCSISILTVDTPIEECIKRNALRTKDRQVPESAIRKMHSQMGFMSADVELAKAKARRNA